MNPSSSPSWLTTVLDNGSGGNFEGEKNTLVELEDGRSLLLPCNVSMQQKRTNIWLRYTVESKMPVDKTPYTSDGRVKLHYRYPNSWNLQIEKKTRKD